MVFKPRKVASFILLNMKRNVRFMVRDLGKNAKTLRKLSRLLKTKKGLKSYSVYAVKTRFSMGSLRFRVFVFESGPLIRELFGIGLLWRSAKRRSGVIALNRLRLRNLRYYKEMPSFICKVFSWKIGFIFFPLVLKF